MEVTTKNGDILQWEGDAAVGAQVSIKVGEEFIFAEAGEYELEDGTKLILDVEGKVAEIVAPQEEELADTDTTVIEPTNQTYALDPAEVMMAIQPALDEFRSILAELATRLDLIENTEVNTDEELTKELTKEVTELKTQVEKLASAAGVPSITVKNDEYTETKTKHNEKLLHKINFFSKY